jgi:hypothetical protein
VRKVLSQPAIAALVSHNRKLLYDEHGEPISAGEGIATMADAPASWPSWSGVPL